MKNSRFLLHRRFLWIFEALLSPLSTQLSKSRIQVLCRIGATVLIAVAGNSQDVFACNNLAKRAGKTRW